MILTGSEIRRAVESGQITIDPFQPAQLNPNSYNYRLGDLLKTIEESCIDPARVSATHEFEIPDTGVVLEPGRVYLGSTVETIGSSHFVTSLIGRSSLGRLGVFLQVSADLGQLGAVHRWTLELVVAQPVRLYRGMRVGQVSFWVPNGEVAEYAGYFGRFSSPRESHPAALGLVNPRR